MKLNRRDFLTVSAVTGVVGAVAPTAKAFTLPDPPQKARLRLSCQEGVAPGNTLAEKLDFLEANGFEGFEPGGGGLASRIEELQKALRAARSRSAPSVPASKASSSPNRKKSAKPPSPA